MLKDGQDIRSMDTDIDEIKEDYSELKGMLKKLTKAIERDAARFKENMKEEVFNILTEWRDSEKKKGKGPVVPASTTAPPATIPTPATTIPPIPSGSG